MNLVQACALGSHRECSGVSAVGACPCDCHAPSFAEPSDRPASNRDHWLTFHHDDERDRQVVDGCHCGFGADVYEDEGWGDSVVDHLINVGVAWARSADLQTQACGSGDD